MERLPNVNSNGQQAPNQVPATGEHPTQVVASSDVPKPNFDFPSRSVSPFAGIPQLTAVMPDGSTRTMKFQKVLRNRKVVNAFWGTLGYGNNPRQSIQRANLPHNPNLSGLSRLAPVSTKYGLIDPLPLYQLFVANPVVFGTVLAQLD
jgi:hypothetical protein